MSSTPLGTRIENLRRSKRGRSFLRTFVILCVVVVVWPICAVLWLGASTAWFSDVPPLGSLAFNAVDLLEDVKSTNTELVANVLAAFPAIAFAMIYAGNSETRLTSFGFGILMTLLAGVALGTFLALIVDPMQDQLPCQDPVRCMEWLREKCSDSARQCLTFLFLILGFDKFAPQKVNRRSTDQ